MNINWKRSAALAGMAAALVIVSSDAAFAFGRSKKSGYKGWEANSSTSNPGSNTGKGNSNVAELPFSNDANPVPEPASMLLLGTALAGAAGYRKVKQRLTKKA